MPGVVTVWPFGSWPQIKTLEVNISCVPPSQDGPKDPLVLQSEVNLSGFRAHGTDRDPAVWIKAHKANQGPTLQNEGEPCRMDQDPMGRNRA